VLHMVQRAAVPERVIRETVSTEQYKAEQASALIVKGSSPCWGYLWGLLRSQS